MAASWGRITDHPPGSAPGRDDNNAYLTFEERTKGSIEPGKLADLVVLPEDILTCPEERIEQMQVAMTMVGGKVVYRRP